MKFKPHRKEDPMHFPTKPMRKRLARAMLAAACASIMTACLSAGENTGPEKDPVDKPVPDAIARPFVFALSTDYRTGNYSAFGLDTAAALIDIAPIHSDATVRYLGGDDIFILNRLKRDNLQVISSRNLKTVMQIQFPAQSNPYDIAVKDSLLYVACFGLDKILVFRQSDGSAQGEIDVSEFADSSDGFAETSEIMFVGGYLYALTANLDMKTYGPPMTAHLLKIDAATRTVTSSLELPFGNPASLTYDSVSGNIHIPCRGEYSHPDFTVKKDGGIVTVDLAAFTVTDTLIMEDALGGNVNGALFHDGKLFMSLGTDAKDRIIAISLLGAQVEVIAELPGYGTGGMAIDAPSRTLVVGDRGGKSLRYFDLDTFDERSAASAGMELPPSSLAIIR